MVRTQTVQTDQDEQRGGAQDLLLSYLFLANKTQQQILRSTQTQATQGKPWLGKMIL